MLLINTKVIESRIHGYGLVTIDYLEPGQVIFEDSDLIKITEKVYNKIPDKSWIDKFCTVEEVDFEKTYILDRDNMKYINHSSIPNICFIGNIAVTLKIIMSGTELSCDYSEITTEENYNKLLNI